MNTKVKAPSKKANLHSAVSLHREHSKLVVDGAERAASRAMLHAVGFAREDFKKSQIGIASTWSMVTPCNMHIDGLARQAEAGANTAGAKGVIFGTITISDGISMGTEGMKYSLVSREVIADSIETVMGCEGFDGLVAIGGCDKNMPACIIAMARLNRPSIFVYGGTILPGCITGVLAERRLRSDRRERFADKNLDIVSCFEAVGEHANGKLDDRELALIEENAIPGAGSCGGMYTANTMASAIEALGMSLPNSSAQNATSPAKAADARADRDGDGGLAVRLVQRDAHRIERRAGHRQHEPGPERPGRIVAVADHQQQPRAGTGHALGSGPTAAHHASPQRPAR